MLLLDEKDKDLIVSYDVMFPEENRKFVRSTLIELLSKPSLSSEEIEPVKKRDFIKENKMDSVVDSPLIRTTELTLSNIKKSTYVISYDTPFTIAFLWQKSPFKWGINNITSISREYMLEKAKNINTDNLSLLFKKINDMGKLDELYTYFETKSYPMNDYFKTSYPDVAYFSAVFPMANFTPKDTMSIREGKIDVNCFGDESDREVLDWKIETATNNTEIVKRLKLHPDIRR